MKKREKTRFLSMVLSVLIVVLIVQTFMVWFFPQSDSSWRSSTGMVSLFVFEPTPDPSMGEVTLEVVGGEA